MGALKRLINIIRAKVNKLLAVLLQGLARLVLQLGPLLLELGCLDLDPLSGGGDLGDAATDLLEVLELLLVGEVEGVARVLGAIEDPVRLGTEDVQKALEQAHRAVVLQYAPDDRRVRRP